MLLLIMISLLCVVVMWRAFEVPEDRWQVKSETAMVPEQKTATPLQIQLLPWRSYFVVDKNRPVRGVAMGYFLQQNDIQGVSMALMHASNDRKSGVSLSLVELSGTSSGLAMYLAGGPVKNNGLTVGLWNMAECNNGVQLGLLNQIQENIIADYSMKAEKPRDGFGVQAGVVNYSEGRGVQFGLWNTNPNGWVKHFPLINICL